MAARLRKACLASANLTGADLTAADLGSCDLRDADLGGADLSGVAAVGACFEAAVLLGARLQHTELGGADLTGAWFGDTIVVACSGSVAGWRSARHVGPSTVDCRSVAHMAGVPNTFHQGCCGPLAAATERVVVAEEIAAGRAAWWVAADDFLRARARARARMLLERATRRVLASPKAPAEWPQIFADEARALKVQIRFEQAAKPPVFE